MNARHLYSKYTISICIHLACSAGVFFEREICSQKRHVETSQREEVFFSSPPPPFRPRTYRKGYYFYSALKIKDGGYNNITKTNKVSPTQNTPALQAKEKQAGVKHCFYLDWVKMQFPTADEASV